MAARRRTAATPPSGGDPSQESAEPFDHERYASFIGQIRLQGIWLASAKILNRTGPAMPNNIAIRIDDDATWEAQDWGFRAFTNYHVRLTEGRKQLASVDATFAVDFASREPMSDSIFATFGEVNLPVNTWPYLREFLASSLSRMNWTPFTLPALKRGVPSTTSDPATTTDGADEAYIPA